MNARAKRSDVASMARRPVETHTANHPIHPMFRKLREYVQKRSQHIGLHQKCGIRSRQGAQLQNPNSAVCRVSTMSGAKSEIVPFCVKCDDLLDESEKTGEIPAAISSAPSYANEATYAPISERISLLSKLRWNSWRIHPVPVTMHTTLSGLSLSTDPSDK
jgi:hypothetical protein